MTFATYFRKDRKEIGMVEVFPKRGHVLDPTGILRLEHHVSQLN
jgi:hypothetical protein